MSSKTPRRIAYQDLKRAMIHVDTSLEQPDPAVLSRARCLFGLYPGAWSEVLSRAHLAPERRAWVEGWIRPRTATPPPVEGQSGLFDG